MNIATYLNGVYIAPNTFQTPCGKVKKHFQQGLSPKIGEKYYILIIDDVICNLIEYGK